MKDEQSSGNKHARPVDGRIRLAQIGTGYWGRNHARVWAELKEEGIIEDLLLVELI